MKHGFYDENDEILKNAIALTADEQNMWEIVEISQIATQIIRIAVPNEGKDEISIMAKVFANTLALLLGIFLETSQMY